MKYLSQDGSQKMAGLAVPVCLSCLAEPIYLWIGDVGGLRAKLDQYAAPDRREGFGTGLWAFIHRGLSERFEAIEAGLEAKYQYSGHEFIRELAAAITFSDRAAPVGGDYLQHPEPLLGLIPIDSATGETQSVKLRHRAMSRLVQDQVHSWGTYDRYRQALRDFTAWETEQLDCGWDIIGGTEIALMGNPELAAYTDAVDAAEETLKAIHHATAQQAGFWV